MASRLSWSSGHSILLRLRLSSMLRKSLSRGRCPLLLSSLSLRIICLLKWRPISAGVSTPISQRASTSVFTNAAGGSRKRAAYYEEMCWQIIVGSRNKYKRNHVLFSALVEGLWINLLLNECFRTRAVILDSNFFNFCFRGFYEFPSRIPPIIQVIIIIITKLNVARSTPRTNILKISGLSLRSQSDLAVEWNSILRHLKDV